MYLSLIYIIISMSPVKFKKLSFRRVEFSGPDRDTTIQCSMGFYDHMGQDWSVIILKSRFLHYWSVVPPSGVE